jgi:hypothetical protein
MEDGGLRMAGGKRIVYPRITRIDTNFFAEFNREISEPREKRFSTTDYTDLSAGRAGGKCFTRIASTLRSNATEDRRI